jgi:hypothetical protein
VLYAVVALSLLLLTKTHFLLILFLQWTSISRNRYNKDGKHTIAHVMMACGEHVRGMGAAGLAKQIIKLDREKIGIMNWARHVIRGQMIVAAREKNLLVAGVKVKFFRDIGSAWVASQDGGTRMGKQAAEKVAAQVFYVTQGAWDMRKGWAAEMEKKFMEWKRMTYNEGDGVLRKGIIEKMISYQKLQMVKSIMRPAKRKGMGTLSVRRSKVELIERGQRRNTNRRKGEFDIAYLKRGRTQLGNDGSEEEDEFHKVRGTVLGIVLCRRWLTWNDADWLQEINRHISKKATKRPVDEVMSDESGMVAAKVSTN